jgi:hypothetical protein
LVLVYVVFQGSVGSSRNNSSLQFSKNKGRARDGAAFVVIGSLVKNSTRIGLIQWLRMHSEIAKNSKFSL